MTHHPCFKLFSKCCGTNHINTSHSSFLLAGNPPGRQHVHMKSKGDRAAPCSRALLSQQHLGEPSRRWDRAQVSTGNCLKAPTTLHIQDLIYLSSTNLTTSQSRDGGTAARRSQFSTHKGLSLRLLDQKFAGKYISISRSTCHTEKCQVILKGNCKCFIFRKISTAFQN